MPFWSTAKASGKVPYLHLMLAGSELSRDEDDRSLSLLQCILREIASSNSGRAIPRWADGRSSRIKEALPDDRLDGKMPTALQGRYPRGHLSRPACSHVKQVAKR